MSRDAFILINALLWGIAAAVTFARRQRAIPQAQFVAQQSEKAQWMRPMLPWISLVLAIYSIVEFSRTSDLSGVFAGGGLSSAALLCIELYIALVQRGNGPWKKASTLKTVLFWLFLIGVAVGFVGYIVTTGSY